MRYQVIEHGECLMLFVWIDRGLLGFDEYELNPGSLTNDIDYLTTSREMPHTWDNVIKDPYALRESLIESDDDWAVIAEGPPLRTFRQRMGEAGRREFKVREEA